MDIIKQSQPKARKDYICDFCNQTIYKGDVYDRTTISDDNIYDWICHLQCSDISRFIWSYVDPWEGMDGELFLDGCQSVCKRFVCHDCVDYDKYNYICKNGNRYCLDKLYELSQKYYLKREPKWFGDWILVNQKEI